MTIIGDMTIRRIAVRIDRQRRSGCILHVPEERRAYARRCMAEIVAGTAAQDRADRIRWTQSFQNSDIGGAA